MLLPTHTPTTSRGVVISALAQISFAGSRHTSHDTRMPHAVHEADDIDPTGHLLAMLENPHLAHKIAALEHEDDASEDTDVWDEDNI